MAPTCRHFLCNLYPYAPFSPYFFTTLPLLGLFPPQMVHLLPAPNMGHVSTLSPPCFGDPQDGRVYVATLPTCEAMGVNEYRHSLRSLGEQPFAQLYSYAVSGDQCT